MWHDRDERCKETNKERQNDGKKKYIRIGEKNEFRLRNSEILTKSEISLKEQAKIFFFLSIRLLYFSFFGCCSLERWELKHQIESQGMGKLKKARNGENSTTTFPSYPPCWQCFYATCWPHVNSTEQNTHQSWICQTIRLSFFFAVSSFVCLALFSRVVDVVRLRNRIENKMKF